MRTIWNPWHGCTKCSEGCLNCYMYFLDRIHGEPGAVRDSTDAARKSAEVKKTSAFRYPLSRGRDGQYKIRSGETLSVCLTSDFFVEGADAWRQDAWDVMRQRPDVIFSLLTKRPQRAEEQLPPDWGDGWENISFGVTAENQKRADERIPILLSLPLRHRWIMVAPFIGPVSIRKYLAQAGDKIDRVLCGGENYDGARPCDFDWVKTLSEECREYGVTFSFFETGTVFVKDGKTYRMPDKGVQHRMAFRSGVSHGGREVRYDLRDGLGIPLPDHSGEAAYFGPRCAECSGKITKTCRGCSRCERCQYEK